MNAMQYATGMIGCWESSSDWVEIHAEPPTPGEAHPFHVMLRGDGWIPVSLLVFARDEVHACRRVVASLLKVIEQQGEIDVSRGRALAQRILREAGEGNLRWHVEPYDTALLCAKVNWARNGGIL